MNTAVILAAGMGIRLSPIVGIRPKGLLKIGDCPLLGRSINMLKKHGIKKIVIVTGHQSEMLKTELEDFTSSIETHFCFNENYEQSGSMHSLFMLQGLLYEDFLLLESDLLFEEEAIISILNEQNNDVLLISGKTNSGDEVWIYGDKNSGNESKGLIKKINKQIYKGLETIGELTGISKISYELFQKMCDHHSNKISFPNNFHYEECISDLCDQHEIQYLKMENLIWTEIDDPQHYKRAVEEIWPLLMKKNVP